eukprot:TRINITY_DN3254_c0_g1_i2.p1 TRINITY_DN3254_c0_g1~~TRINITY_DN3254_c0_g1_i2.p1  ORF type:complete len:195 (-),score=41.77 TRINITY_DN3254_c0_g1_i2:117-701(-)
MSYLARIDGYTPGWAQWTVDASPRHITSVEVISTGDALWRDGSIAWALWLYPDSSESYSAMPLVTEQRTTADNLVQLGNLKNFFSGNSYHKVGLRAELNGSQGCAHQNAQLARVPLDESRDSEGGLLRLVFQLAPHTWAPSTHMSFPLSSRAVAVAVLIMAHVDRNTGAPDHPEALWHTLPETLLHCIIDLALH